MNNFANNSLNTNTNSGKVTILLIALGVILIVFVAIMSYINYMKYNQYKIQDFVEEKLLDKLHNCKNNLLSIPANKIPSSSLGNEYSLNMWLYINDFNYKYGEPKYVLMKGSTNRDPDGHYYSTNPGIYLDGDKNDLVINVELQSQTNVADESSVLAPSPSDEVLYAQCRVSNISLQRWVCINLSLYNNIMDVYLDGKLYKSCIFNGFPKPNNEPMFFGFDGGFDGFVSRITWANKNLSPEEIYSRYEQGPKILENPVQKLKNALGL
jgi:hypothetical protein